MWPRLIAQLVELLPHAARLLPLADNYFATRREADGAQAAALAAMAGSLREEIGRVGESFGGVPRQLAEQKQQIAALQDALEAAETHRITQTKQLEWITSDLNSLRVWVKFGVVVIILLLTGLSALTVQIFRLR
jgi:septal ring factor EnvC (AmiA/AmiB activator)